MKILIAEDSLTQATLMKISLQRKGYDIVLARDGIDAIKKAYQEQPDLIVSDVVMPRVNGYQVCRLLRDDPKTAHIPVVLLTSLDQRQDAFWGLKSGAEKFITKGGDIPSLVDEIDGFVTTRQRAGAWRAAAEAGREPSADLDADVMERVIHLLDHNLFESTVVTEIQNLVNSLDDFRKTMVGMLEILKKVIDFHVGAIHLGGEESQGLFLLVNKPVDQKFIDYVTALTLRESYGRDVSPPEPEETEVFDPDHLLTRPGSHPVVPGSVLVTPLTTKGMRSGVITIADAAEHAFPDRVEQTFEMLVRQANIVIDYARLYERNKQLSITDGLTKLYNHRFFQDALKREFSRSSRHKTPLSLIMLDIDHFKRFNDTHGHQQGDVVLQELARILRSQVRSLDIVARYGGEEFAIIMPDAPGEISHRVAERLRGAVEGHPVAGPEGPLVVTISLGVATVPDPGISNPTELITVADRALYRAKERGRNQVAY
jgi:two-component system cell cycle response regulator